MNLPTHPPARWEKLNDTLHASCRVFNVTRSKYRHPGRSTEKDFFTINSTDWVNVLALTPDDHLVLVNQFRFGSDAFSLEIPGGMIEPGEDPLAGGLRELAEETGYVGDNARIIGRVRPNPAIQTNTCHFVLVENAIRNLQVDWDTDEEIQVMTRPVEEVFASAYAGEINHALVLDALFFFSPEWANLKGKAV